MNSSACLLSFKEVQCYGNNRNREADFHPMAWHAELLASKAA